ncbi:MAG: outer membrane beta-barrel domain-containing protein [Myxococcota bacterium]
MFRSLLRSSILIAGLTAGGTALAQDETDLPDDLFGDDDVTPPEPSAAQEKAQLLNEADQPEVVLPDERPKKRIIQTFQRKNFLKINRAEPAVMAGFVTNDPFVNRYLLNVGIGYHITEIFAVEASGYLSPDLGTGDYKAITHQIIEENDVTPDISKIQFFGSIAFQFSPIYGKIAVGAHRIIGFDLYALAGTGIVNTLDDLAALQKVGEPEAEATKSQFHPTLNYGGGARVIFGKSFAVRIEGRGLSYIEVLESTTLEMKNNFTLLAGASIFFPGMD